VIFGGCVSFTVTVKEQLTPAVAVHVTVVVPFGNAEPLGGVQVMVPQLPVVIGAAYATTAVHAPGSVEAVTFAGHVIEQGVTDTVKEQVAVLVEVSVAVHVTVVVPTGNAEPDAGTQLAVAPGQLSAGAGVV
jgi:hypothetical protein